MQPRRWTWEEVPTATLDDTDAVTYVQTRRLRCKPGGFPWDEWLERARAAGVSDALATLGRAVIREAYQHGWSAKLQAECGWEDDGDAMLAFALQDPTRATKLWSWLLESDGAQGFD